jgi:hypothetical protein
LRVSYLTLRNFLGTGFVYRAAMISMRYFPGRTLTLSPSAKALLLRGHGCRALLGAGKLKGCKIVARARFERPRTLARGDLDCAIQCASTAPPIGRPSCNSNLMLYKSDKDFLVPQLANTEVRLPRLTNRHVTVKERHHQCLTDYQWVFWGKIDKPEQEPAQGVAPGYGAKAPQAQEERRRAGH